MPSDHHHKNKKRKRSNNHDEEEEEDHVIAAAAAASAAATDEESDDISSKNDQSNNNTSSASSALNSLQKKEDSKPIPREDYYKIFLSTCHLSSSSKGFSSVASMPMVAIPANYRNNKILLDHCSSLETSGRPGDCYAAYNDAKKNYAAYVKEFKRIQKENAPIYQKIGDALEAAIKHQKSCDKFKGNGKESQASSAHKKSIESVKEAKIMYDKMATEEDKENLLDAQKEFLDSPTLSGLYLLDKKLSGSNEGNDDDDAGGGGGGGDDDDNGSKNNDATNGSSSSSNVEDVRTLKTKMRKCKKYIDEITKTIDAALPYIESDEHKVRLEQLLEKKEEIVAVVASSSAANR